MKAKLITCRQIIGCKPNNGTYLGIWDGYQVTFYDGNKTFIGKTDIGIRIPKAECIVTINDKEMIVKVKDENKNKS
jgi:hypothetical protein